MTAPVPDSPSLLAYTPPLKLGSCCAKSANNVRKATLEDVQAWIADQEPHRTSGDVVGIANIIHNMRRTDATPEAIARAVIPEVRALLDLEQPNGSCTRCQQLEAMVDHLFDASGMDNAMSLEEFKATYMGKL